MAQFVHLAGSHDVDSIRRAGIKVHRRWGPSQQGFHRAVYAMPVIDNFYVSHQWLRELKRRGQRTIMGIYFRIPDDLPVLVGHYNENHARMTADQAVGLMFHADQAEGWEVLIDRKIEPSEIFKIQTLPQVLGWRYYPGAKGRKPCGCSFCISRGEIKSKRIRDAYERDN